MVRRPRPRTATVTAITGDEVGIYSGLDGPYTYSDMTGWGLINNACNPEG